MDTTDMKQAYRLVDVVRRGQMSHNFYVPPLEARSSLCRGDYVKLIFNDAERMWVKVTGIEGDCYVGELCNHPVTVDTLRHGDEIRFQARHIADISATN